MNPGVRGTDEPIQAEAIARLRRLGKDADGVEIFPLVVDTFRHEATVWSDGIRSGLASGDLAAVQRIAHTLRGSASTLGASRLAEICGELEACAHDGNARLCELQTSSLEKALSEVLTALSEALSSP